MASACDIKRPAFSLLPRRLTMQSITFAFPTLTTAQMTRQDQIDVTVNQATAAIVCCFLEHMNVAINKGLPGAGAATGGVNVVATDTGATTIPADTAFISAGELLNLINGVQNALRTVT